MGIFSWFTGNKKSTSPKPDLNSESKIQQSSSSSPAAATEEVPGMNGAMKVPRPDPPADITVFEFGSVAASVDKVTLAGYCPVSDDLEPCRWQILPASDSGAPQFRVVF